MSGVDIRKVHTLCYVWDPSGFYWGWQPCYLTKYPKRVVLLNALVPADQVIINVRRIDVATAIEIIKNAEEVISYIGHKSTADLLSQLTGRPIPVNRGEWAPTADYGENEFAVIVRLKRRQQTPGGGDAQVVLEDLEFMAATYVRYNMIGP